MQSAANIYAQGPNYAPGFSSVAQLTPNQTNSINGINNYVNSAGNQQMLNNGSSAVQNLLTGSNNPYTNLNNTIAPNVAGYLSNNNGMNPAQGLNQFMNANLNDAGLQGALSDGVNQTNNAMGNIIPGLHNTFGFGQNLANNSAQLAQNTAMSNTLGNEFDQQNTNRLAAAGDASNIGTNKANLGAGLLNSGGEYGNNQQSLGLSNYGSMLSNPLTQLQDLFNAGGIQQTQNQQQLTNATQNYTQNQNAQMTALDQLMSLINPVASQGGSSIGQGTSTSNQSGPSTASQITGGVGQGAQVGMLLSSLMA